MILTFGCTKWYGGTFVQLCKKAEKSVKNWKGNTTRRIYASLMQCKFVIVLSITSNIFWETKVEILEIGCARKYDLLRQSNVNKAHEFVLYMSKQSMSFNDAEAS